MTERVHTEEWKVSGEAVVSNIKQILHEGNVRRITLKNEEGKTLIEIPLTLGVVGALLLPTWAAIGAIAALAARLTIVVEKVDETPENPENIPVEGAAPSGGTAGTYGTEPPSGGMAGTPGGAPTMPGEYDPHI